MSKPCTFFMKGFCKYGTNCRFDHPGEPKPPCKYHALLDCAGCGNPHIPHPIAPRSSPATVKLSTESKEKIYVAIDPTGARVLDDAFCLQITGSGKKRRATLELCLVNPFPKLSELGADTTKILEGAARRGLDSYSEGVKMLQPDVPIDAKSSVTLGEWCGLSDKVASNVLILTVTFTILEGKWKAEPLGKRPVRDGKVKIVRKNYSSIEDDAAYLNECVELAANYLGTTADAILVPGQRGVNGLAVSQFMSKSFLKEEHGFKSSSQCCKGALVVKTFKKMFDACALEFLAASGRCHSLLVEECPLALTPEYDPLLPMDTLKQISCGMCHIQGRCKTKYALISPMELHQELQAQPQRFESPAFSPALRAFAPLYNTMVLVHVVSPFEFLPLATSAADSALLSYLASSVNAEKEYELKVNQTMFEEYLQAPQIFVVEQRAGSPPDFRKSPNAKLETVAVRTKEESSSLNFRLTSIDGWIRVSDKAVELEVSGNYRPGLPTSEKFSFELTLDKVVKGVSRLTLDLTTHTATWYQRTKQEMNQIVAVEIVRQAARMTRSNFKLHNLPSEVCDRMEDCSDAHCCRVHSALNALVVFKNPTFRPRMVSSVRHYDDQSDESQPCDEGGLWGARHFSPGRVGPRDEDDPYAYDEEFE